MPAGRAASRAAAGLRTGRGRQLGSACSWRLTAEPVQGHAARVLDDLKRDGIAVTVLSNADNAAPGDIADALYNALLTAENMGLVRECR